MVAKEESEGGERCRERTLGNLFSQPWWLDAVAPGRWDAVEISENGKVIARLPYTYQETRGGVNLLMPVLTQTLGPAFAELPGKICARLSRQHDLMSRLIDGLPRFRSFFQHFSPAITNWLPFYWRGFSQTTRYTYRLEDLSDLDAIWSGLSEPTRRAIRKAKRELAVMESNDLTPFLKLNEMVFARQNIPMRYDIAALERVDSACRERNARTVLLAKDSEGRLHAGVYLIHDSEETYYLLGGSDPMLRQSAASSLLLWEAIQRAAGSSRVFDLEGSMIEPIEKFFRGFGARQTPYFAVHLDRSWGARSGEFVRKAIRRMERWAGFA